MGNHDFKFDSFRWVEHEDFPKIVAEIRERFKDAGILDLLAELDHVTNKPDKEKYIQLTKLTTIKRLISIKLDLFDNEHAEYMIDTLPGYIEANETEIRKLDTKFRKHRHDKDKSFSSVPI